MSLVKCEHCNIRIPARGVELHLKRCVNYRRKLKAGTLKQTEKVVAPKKEKEKIVAPVANKPLSKKQLAKLAKAEKQKAKG